MQINQNTTNNHVLHVEGYAVDEHVYARRINKQISEVVIRPDRVYFSPQPTQSRGFKGFFKKYFCCRQPTRIYIDGRPPHVVNARPAR